MDKNILKLYVELGIIDRGTAKVWGQYDKMAMQLKKTITGLENAKTLLQVKNTKLINNEITLTKQTQAEINAMERLNTTINKSATQINMLKNKMAQIEMGFNKITSTTVAARQSMKLFADTSSGAFQSTFFTMRRIMTTMITLGGLFYFKNLIQQSMEFENTMIHVGAIAKASGTEFTALVSGMRRIARETIFSSTEVAGVAETLAQMGLSVKDILIATEPILKLTASTMGNLQEVTQLVTSALITFNLGFEKTADVANILSAATIESKADIQKLGIAFNYAGPAGAAFNQTLEMTVAAVSKFIDMGLQASTAGTTFRRALYELANAGAKQEKVLQKLNVRYEEVNPAFNSFDQIVRVMAKTALTSADAIELFGDRAGAAMYVLIQRIRDGGETVGDFAKKLADAKDVNIIDQIYTKMFRSMKSESMLTRAELNDFGMTLFEMLKPAMSEGFTRIRDGVKSFNEELKKSTGKDFGQTIKELVPLFFDVSTIILKTASVIGGTIIQIVSFAQSLGILSPIIKTIVELMGVYFVAKMFLFNNVVSTTINLFGNFGRSILSTNLNLKILAVTSKITTASVTFMGRSFQIATLAARAFQVATGLIVVTVGLVALQYVIGKISDLFMKSKEIIDDNSDSLGQLGEQAGFTSEQLKKVTEQTGYQIDNLKELNDLLEQGKILMGTIPEAYAIKIEFPSISKIEQNIKEIAPSLESIIDATHTLMSAYIDKVPNPLDNLFKGLGSTPELEKNMEEYKNYLESTTSEINAAVGGNLSDIQKQLELIATRHGKDDFNKFYTPEGEKNLKALIEELKKVGLASDVMIREKGGYNIKLLINDIINLSKMQTSMLNTAIDPVRTDYQFLLNFGGIVEKQTVDIIERFKEWKQGGVKSVDELITKRKEINQLAEDYEIINTNTIDAQKRLNEELKNAQRATKEGKGTVAGENIITLQVKAMDELFKKLDKSRDALEKIKDEMSIIVVDTELAKLKQEKARKEIVLEQLVRQQITHEMQGQQDLLDKYMVGEERYIKLHTEYAQKATKYKMLIDEKKVLQQQISIAESSVKIKAKEADIVRKYNSIIGVRGKEAIEYGDIQQKELDKSEKGKALLEDMASVEKLRTPIQKLRSDLLNKETEQMQMIQDINNDLVTISDEQIQRQMKLTHSDEYINVYNINKAYEERITTLNEALDLNAEELASTNKLSPAYLKLSIQQINIIKYKSITEKLNKDELEQLKEKTILQEQINALDMADVGFGEQAAAIRKKPLEIELKLIELRKKQHDLEDPNSDYRKNLHLTTDEAEELNRAIQEQIDKKEIMAHGTFGEKFHLQFKDAIADMIAFEDASTIAVDAIKDVADQVTDLVKTMAKEKLQNWVNSLFGIESEQDKKMREIYDKYNEEVAKIEKEFRDKMSKAEQDHLEKMEEIRVRFDDMRREKESEIYNERVNKLMELAALEEQLRNKGLNSEQERAALIQQIDQGMASAQIGSIEARQVKLAQLEEQIKSLNDLENTLGMSRSEIENSSIQRMQQLRNVTDSFYQDKQRLAVADIEQQRTIEMGRENIRYAGEIGQITQERDQALQDALDARNKALAELFKDMDDKEKQRWADLTTGILSIAGEALMKAAASAIIGPAGLALNQGGYIRRATGGVISGGNGGIDDIHTSLPRNSFVINREATTRHLAELQRMTASGSAQTSNRLPVALTSGEYIVYPPVSNRLRSRLEQINADKQGGSMGYASGGNVSGGSSILVNVNTNFSGVNLISGESEAEVSEFYNNFIKTKIQNDINNQSINFRRN